MARKSRRTRRLRVVNPDCAGIDIGKGRHFVAVEVERSDEPVRSFGGVTRDLEAMAAWLASCGVTKVAMESTSVYWIPVYETLERAGFEVLLVPPRMTKQIGGRQSDVLDCQWIWQLMSYGLLRGAARTSPPSPPPSTSAPGLRSHREPGSAAARTSPASPRRRSTPSGRPYAWRPWPRAAARPSSAPSTAPGSPEWTPPLRSRRPPANSPV